nr:hypothetical protein [Candidatus Sigynarchaeum springense]MDO8115942.1 hypothetical protein [Candidatus Sigynarchaeota archaeon]
MENFQEQIAQLEKKMLSMEAEKQARDANRIKLEQEIRPLRNELDQLRQPQLLYSRIAMILPDGRVLVDADGGFRKYIVNVAIASHNCLSIHSRDKGYEFYIIKHVIGF